MNGVLALARDYIERMSNPIYGLSTNEEYSADFGQLLRSEEFVDQLRQDMQTLKDPIEMTSHGWVWLLGWARANHVPLQHELLIRLFDEWSSVFVKTAVVDLATQEPPDRETRARASVDDAYQNHFLASIMANATESAPPRDVLGSDPQHPLPTLGRAEATLTALLQVGRPITLGAARLLLQREWPGQEALQTFFWSLVDSLEPQTRETWLAQILPPPRPRPAR